jgi:excisionase family DNA binding protein
VNDTDDKTRLISLAEAAELYGFSHNYLRRLVNRERLEAQKVGNSWVTTPQAVEKYIASRKERGVFRNDIQPLDWQLDH